MRRERSAPDALHQAARAATPIPKLNGHADTDALPPLALEQLLAALQAVQAGDFSVRLPGHQTGLAGKIADTFNDIVSTNQRMAKQLERVGDVVGKQGKTRQRVTIGSGKGAWGEMETSVNTLIDDLLWPTAEVTRAIAAVAKGDLLQTVNLDVDGRPLKGEFLRAASIVNTMIKQLSVFTSEVTRVAREVGTDGKLGGQAEVPGVTGTWKDLTDSVNCMTGNLTAQVHNIAEVATAIAGGDPSRKITVDVRGEILQLKETLNTMVVQLNRFAGELTRAAREVGTEGNMGSWDYDLTSKTGFWDEGQSRIFGVNHAGFVPSVENICRGIHSDDLDTCREALIKLSVQQPTCELQFRIVRPGGEVRWCTVAAAASFDASGVLVRYSGVTTDITDRKEAESRQALLTREVDHRVKNTLAVVQAIIRMAKRDNVEDYVKAVEGRIGALAQTHELLSQSRWEGVDILRLILDEMAPYHSGGQQRVTAMGPSLVLVPEQAQLLAMAIHELATNAAKYGSLSVDTGRVDVCWSTYEGVLSLVWRESLGPKVSRPRKVGFGTRVISSLGTGRKGRAEFDWRHSGLTFTLQMQYRHDGNGAAPELEISGHAGPRLLLVEDELVVGMFMQDVLETIGYRPTSPIGHLAEAVAAAKSERFLGAVLDMNLHGEIVYPLAELLTAQRVPFLFVTGYAPHTIDPRFAAIPILQKPVLEEQLSTALQKVLGRQDVMSRQRMVLG